MHTRDAAPFQWPSASVPGQSPVCALPPTPTLLARAGAPFPPGAGPMEEGGVRRGLPAVLVEDDELVLPQALRAIEALGYAVVAGGAAPGGAAPPATTASPAIAACPPCRHRSSAADLGAAPGRLPAARFVGLHGLVSVATCPLLRERRRPPPGGSSAGRQAAPFTVGYAARDPLVAALHRVHRCADLLVVLHPAGGTAHFAHLQWPCVFEEAGVTPREAEVLALLVARRSNAEIAETLVLSQATVRAHSRALFRKLGCSGRRSLWGLATPASWARGLEA